MPLVKGKVQKAISKSVEMEVKHDKPLKHIVDSSIAGMGKKMSQHHNVMKSCGAME